jgi:hypothetical protein
MDQAAIGQAAQCLAASSGLALVVLAASGVLAVASEQAGDPGPMADLAIIRAPVINRVPVLAPIRALVPARIRVNRMAVSSV